MGLFWFIVGLLLGGAAVFVYLNKSYRMIVSHLEEQLQTSEKNLENARKQLLEEDHEVRVVRQELYSPVHLKAEVLVSKYDLHNPAINAAAMVEDRLRDKLCESILSYAVIQGKEDHCLEAIKVQASVAILPPKAPGSVREFIGKPEKRTEMLVIDVCAGNPGALTFAMAAIEKDPGAAFHGLNRMKEAGITGSRLYMLWNDCCSRDTAETLKVMLDYPIDLIHRHINYESGRGIPFNATAGEVPNGPGPDTAV